MIITGTQIQGVFTIEQVLRQDERGYFTRVFCQDELKKEGIDYHIAQINSSLTKHKGTIRGLHYQQSPHEEDKIVQCLAGEIYDVAVDIRPHSPTFGKYVGELLSENNHKMLLIPKGCAHGFQTLKPNCVVEYFVSSFYAPTYEKGIKWNDSFFNISWPLQKVTTSPKDDQWPMFRK